MREQMEMLERDLMRLSAAKRYPPAPDLARAIRARLASPERRMAWPQWRLVAVALLPMVLVAIGLIASIAPAREAVADLFGRIDIFQTSESPAAFTTQITGDEATLTTAETRLGQRILLPAYPAGLSPERVLFQDYGRTKAAVLFYNPQGAEPFVLFEIMGVTAKGLPLDGQNTVTIVRDLGDQAYWLTGERIVQYQDEHGVSIPSSRRSTNADALVWQADDGRIFRIEGDLSLEHAVRIAHSLK